MGYLVTMSFAYLYKLLYLKRNSRLAVSWSQKTSYCFVPVTSHTRLLYVKSMQLISEYS
jgi:hypothetical protein